MLQKLVISFLAVCIGFAWAPNSFAQKKKAKSPESQLLLENILQEVQRALIKVQNEAETGSLPPLDNVSLNLSAELASDLDGKISLYIVSFGAGISKTSTQSIRIELTPPKPRTKSPVSSSFGESLSEAILGAAKAVKATQEEEPVLELRELEALLKFVIKKDGQGGVKFAIAPITLDLGGKIQTSETQEIKVTFKQATKTN